MSDDLGGQGAAGSSTRNAGIDQPGNLTLDELAAFERDFDGVDVAIVFWAFQVNYRDARRYEKVRLTADRLTVERGGPSRPAKVWTFQPYWLTVTMDDPPEHHSQLTLSSHGRSLIVGSFLSPDERNDFANALREALSRAKSPQPLPA